MLVRGNIWNRILCHWQVRWLTPEQWAAIPHITPAVIATLVCVGTPPPSHAIVPPPPVAYVPPPGAPFTQLPPPWTTYVPPGAWIPPAGFVPFENGGGGDVRERSGDDHGVGRMGDLSRDVIRRPDLVTPTDQRVPEPGSLATIAVGLVVLLGMTRPRKWLMADFWMRAEHKARMKGQEPTAVEYLAEYAAVSMRPEEKKRQ